MSGKIISLRKRPDNITDYVVTGSNLFTDGNNGTFELGISGMTGVGVSIAQSSDQAHSGSNSLKITTSVEMGVILKGTNQIVLTRGKQYLLSCWVYVESNSTDLYKLKLTFAKAKHTDELAFQDCVIRMVDPFHYNSKTVNKWMQMRAVITVNGVYGVGRIGLAYYADQIDPTTRQMLKSQNPSIYVDDITLKEIVNGSIVKNGNEFLYSENLEVSDEDSVVVNYSLKSLDNSFDVKNFFSKTFKIPETPHNKGVLGDYFNLDISSEELFSKEQLEAQIKQNGYTYITGLLELLRATKTNGVATYECFVVGSNNDWITILEDLAMIDLDLGYIRSRFWEFESTWYNTGETFLTTGRFANEGSNNYYASPLVVNAPFDYGETFSKSLLKIDFIEMRPHLLLYPFLHLLFEKLGYSFEVRGDILTSDQFKNTTLAYIAQDDKVRSANMIRLGEDWMSSHILPFYDELYADQKIDEEPTSPPAIEGGYIGYREEELVFKGLNAIDNANLIKPVTTNGPSYTVFESASEGIYNLEIRLCLRYGNYKYADTQKYSIKKILIQYPDPESKKTDTLQRSSATTQEEATYDDGKLYQGDEIKIVVRHIQGNYHERLQDDIIYDPGWYIDYVEIDVWISDYLYKTVRVNDESGFFDYSYLGRHAWINSYDERRIVYINADEYEVQGRNGSDPWETIWQSTPCIVLKSAHQNWGAWHGFTNVLARPSGDHFAIESERSYLTISELFNDYEPKQIVKDTIALWDIMPLTDTKSKKVTFISRKDFYKNGLLNLLNLSSFMSTDQKQELQEITRLKPRKVEMLYADDTSDELVQKLNTLFTQANLDYRYGCYSENFGGKEDKQIIEVDFSPTAMIRVGNYEGNKGWLIPASSKYGLNPRMLIWMGLTEPPFNNRIQYQHGNSGDIYTVYAIPQIFFYHDKSDFNLSLSHLGDSVQQVIQDISTDEHSLYDVLSFLFLMVIKGRMFKGYFDLSSFVPDQIDFSQFIQVQQTLFLLDEIVDHRIDGSTLTKMILFKLPQQLTGDSTLPDIEIGGGNLKIIGVVTTKATFDIIKGTSGKTITIYWGDDQNTVHNMDGAEHLVDHTYLSSGTYLITIEGDLNAIEILKGDFTTDAFTMFALPDNEYNLLQLHLQFAELFDFELPIDLDLLEKLTLNKVEKLELPNTFTALLELTSEDCEYTSVVIPEELTVLDKIVIKNNIYLETVTLPSALTALTHVEITGTALKKASVNAILQLLDTSGLSNGLVNLSGGNTEMATGAGLTAACKLLGKGWSVTLASALSCASFEITISNHDEITITFKGQTTSPAYSINVDWGDTSNDNYDLNATGVNAQHTYSVANDYTIAITGDIDEITSIVVANGSKVDSVTFSNELSKLQELSLDSQLLTTLTIPTSLIALDDLSLNNNAIADIEGILIALKDIGNYNGSLDLAGGTNQSIAVTGSEGQDALCQLRARNWTTIVNGTHVCDFFWVKTQLTDNIKIKLRGENGNSVTINWGDGTETDYDMTGYEEEITHDYASSGIRTIYLTGDEDKIESLYIDNASDINFSTATTGLKEIELIDFTGTTITLVDEMTVIEKIKCTRSPSLTTITLDKTLHTALNYIDLQHDSLNITTVNAILDSLKTNALTGGILRLSGGSNVMPTGQGLLDVCSLRDAGWFVQLNGVVNCGGHSIINEMILTSDDTLEWDKPFVILDATSNTVTGTLPDPTEKVGNIFIVKAINLTYEAKIIQNGSEKLDGENEYIFDHEQESISLRAMEDGNWKIF